MHHFRGAFSETVYIYEPAIDWSLENCQAPSIMSLGLGLAYNEFLAMAKSLAFAKDIQLYTFEIDTQLVSALDAWIKNESSVWSDAYDQIVTLTANHAKVKPERLTHQIRECYQSGRWKMLGRFPDSVAMDSRFNGILYDAFSRKMDDGLWSQEFLTHFLASHSQTQCCFATYAATGNLKRALKQNQFLLNSKVGFGGKKESTFAFRLDLSPLGNHSQS